LITGAQVILTGKFIDNSDFKANAGDNVLELIKILLAFLSFTIENPTAGFKFVKATQ